MTIRKILLLTLLMFGVLSAMLMTLIAYRQSSSALSSEIRFNLETQAINLTRQIDTLLFERSVNIHGWSRLDIMQEMRVGDVDKRLSRFLADIQRAYNGAYAELYTVAQGRIIASSDATRINSNINSVAARYQLNFQGDKIDLSLLNLGPAQTALLMRTAIHDAFTIQDMGSLQAIIDSSELAKLLDSAVGQGDRHALLIDDTGQILATSSDYHPELKTRHWDVNALNAVDQQHGVYTGSLGTSQGDEMLIGFARFESSHELPDIGWHVLLLTPRQLAIAPVHELLGHLLILLTIIIIIAIVLAFWISARIANPIQQLTVYSRRIGEDLDHSMQNIDGNLEVNELNSAFNRMIADLRQSREHLVRVSKLAAVGEMAAMLAHEVRTPLGIMRSSAQMLSRQSYMDERGREMLDYMLQECDRINDLVSNLLESARPREPVFAPYEIDKLITHVIELVHNEAEKKNIRIEFHSKQNLETITCDRDQFIQVLLNLIMNAIQNITDNGHILITATASEQQALISIEDDGPGIAIEQRQRILEPFVSQRTGGVGLGLPIVQEILQMHQGKLSISDSQLGGAQFQITIPLEIHT